MRILVVSNFYPPHFFGGYELGCFDVVEALKARGHEIAILTSRHGVPNPTQQGDVSRWLTLVNSINPWDWRNLLAAEISDQRAFTRLWRRHRPDVVYLWNLGSLPVSIALRAEARSPTCYYISDGWLAKWTSDLWYTMFNATPAGLRGKIVRDTIRWWFTLRGLTLPTRDLKLEHVQFCSGFMKDATLRAGQPVAEAEVVHWGVDTEKFSPDPAAEDTEDRRARLLYVGQIVPHKGVHTAVEALGLLHAAGSRNATLTIVGGSVSPSYVTRLRERVVALGLDRAVEFAGQRARGDLPSLYRDYGTLVLPSCWDEPFAITPLEAMASGLAVVATTKGGSREIFEEGINALTFPEENAQVCADQLQRILASPQLWMDLSHRARSTVVERFSLKRMVDQIERRLRTVVDDGLVG